MQSGAAVVHCEWLECQIVPNHSSSSSSSRSVINEIKELL